jgi:hemerythrin superfamily protein
MIDDTLLLKIIHLKHFEGGIIDKIMVPMIRENAKKTQRQQDNFSEKFQTYYKAILDKSASYNKKKTTQSWFQKNFTHEKLPSTGHEDI